MNYRQPNNDNQSKSLNRTTITDDLEVKANSYCPMCGQKTVQKYRPFCSKRCADLDLGKWLDGNYYIAGSNDAEEDGSLPFSEQNYAEKSEESS